MRLRRSDPRQHARGREVHRDACDGHQEHGETGHLWRIHQPLDRLHRDQHRKPHQRGSVQLCREDLRAPEPEREITAGGAPREPGGEQRQGDRSRVREHVGRVGEEGERVGEDTGHDLPDHQSQDQNQRERQASRVVRVDVSVVVVSHGVRVACSFGAATCG